MTIADNLGMNSPEIVTGEVQDTPLPVEILYIEGGYWHEVRIYSEELKQILSMIGTGGTPMFEGRQVVAISLNTAEVGDVSYRYIYDFILQNWRFM